MQHLGFNYRITDFQAALGISQLKKLAWFIERRRSIAHLYDNAFRDNPYFDVPPEEFSGSSAYHIYPIRLKGDLREKRKEVFEKLTSEGLGVQVHYMPVYMHPYYQRLGFKKGSCPVAEDYYARTISIPLYPALKDSQIKRVINTVLRVTERVAKR